MKAAPLNNKPNMNFMKQSDLLNFYHIQMPRWLFTPKYKDMPLEAKVAYSFLLNRFQLSKLNNWINDDGEVFIIYTREDLAKELGISYRKAIACMKELSQAGLIWERRCGRGNANQIYLVVVGLNDKDAQSYSSSPFVSPDDEAADGSRHDDLASLEPDCNTGSPDNSTADDNPRDADIAHHDTENNSAAIQDLPEQQLKTCGNGSSGGADNASQDLPNLHPSYIDKNYTYMSNTDNSQSVTASKSRSNIQRNDGQVDDSDLDMILESCELWTFSPETAKVFASAIERLWFSESFRIGNAVLPQKKVRSHLYELDNMRLQEAEWKISRNTEKKIKNATAYTMAVIFNCIWEFESDIMTDPYLNSLKGGGRNVPHEPGAGNRGFGT